MILHRKGSILTSMTHGLCELRRKSRMLPGFKCFVRPAESRERLWLPCEQFSPVKQQSTKTK